MKLSGYFETDEVTARRRLCICLAAKFLYNMDAGLRYNRTVYKYPLGKLEELFLISAKRTNPGLPADMLTKALKELYTSEEDMVD